MTMCDHEGEQCNSHCMCPCMNCMSPEPEDEFDDDGIFILGGRP